MALFSSETLFEGDNLYHQVLLKAKEPSTANYINHIVLVLDASGSMGRYSKTLVTVVDNLIADLAVRSKELDQETRVTVYSFSDYDDISCLIFDKDVLRVPSIASMYKTSNMTALIDATLLSISDLKTTSQLYGDHAFLVYVLTDGLENDSKTVDKNVAIKNKLDTLPENWTVGIFVPDATGIYEAKKHGFPANNISVWNPSTTGVTEVGSVIRKATDNYMQARSTGVRGTKSLFSLNTVTTTQISTELTPLKPSSYSLFYVPVKQRVDTFVLSRTGKKLIIGRAYYQLQKKETIQANKNIVIALNNKMYSGPQARQMLGLPDYTVDVDPSNVKYKDYTIYVQSTAINRNLMEGSNLLLMHEGSNILKH
jgi:hypothetical protein